MRFALVAAIFLISGAAFADIEGLFRGGLDHPAIQYATQPVTDPISVLDSKLQNGVIALKYSAAHGYLESILDSLNIPVESQMLVFSKTSVQAGRIDPQHPRALYYNDSVVVGWVNGGAFLEFAAEDAKQGVVFYTLDQHQADKPRITRQTSCLSCHESYDSLGVPGMLVRSGIPDSGGFPRRDLGGGYSNDHRSPFAERWGGWFVTGHSGDIAHMGNAVIPDPKRPDSIEQTLNLDSLKERLNTDAYLSPYSDIAALMVFEHQMHMMNLFTRVGWEVRLALFEERMRNPKEAEQYHREKTVPLLSEVARQVVDYMLFVDEAPLGAKIEGTPGFTQKFSALGPYDSKHRSLRELDLTKRLMRYPCSYMIYSDAFNALPVEVRNSIYTRLWQVLAGVETDQRYARLTRSDREAIIEILRDTKPDLPKYVGLSER